MIKNVLKHFKGCIITWGCFFLLHDSNLLFHFIITDIFCLAKWERGQGSITQPLRDAIVANNSTEGINVIAGATYTSRDIIEAVNDALNSARN